jgi:hypothetical protein
MKLQIDTENLKIGVDDDIPAGEFFDLLNRFFPDGQWRKFKLTNFRNSYWEVPVFIERWRPLYPYPWVMEPIITYTTGTQDMSLDDLGVVATTADVKIKTGFFNVEII